jgi:hypothetical protein
MTTGRSLRERLSMRRPWMIRELQTAGFIGLISWGKKSDYCQLKMMFIIRLIGLRIL